MWVALIRIWSSPFLITLYISGMLCMLMAKDKSRTIKVMSYSVLSAVKAGWFCVDRGPSVGASMHFLEKYGWKVVPYLVIVWNPFYNTSLYDFIFNLLWLNLINITISAMINMYLYPRHYYNIREFDMKCFGYHRVKTYPCLCTVRSYEMPLFL